MKFGVREIANVVFRTKAAVTIGATSFAKNQPVLYIDSAKTSTLEGAATTVYAQGGRGNTRLIAWEGEKTLTFTVEDALLSPLGFSILSGAGLLKGTDEEKVYVHMTTQQIVSEDDGAVDLTDALGTADGVAKDAPIFVMEVEEDGSLTGKVFAHTAPSDDTSKKITVTDETAKGKIVMVDYYVLKKSSVVSELQIDAENFAGYYYVEADTLFRRQNDGVDMPANLIIPNAKIQSNFTFSMASTGDPSTFTFTMDAMPGYTYFDNARKVLCVLQIIEDENAAGQGVHSVMDTNQVG